MKFKDWQIRAVKTFIQAFGGVLIPELVLFLSNNLPENLTAAKAILIPAVCSALAAGIAAVWNIILEELKKDDTAPTNYVIINNNKQQEDQHNGDNFMG